MHSVWAWNEGRQLRKQLAPKTLGTINVIFATLWLIDHVFESELAFYSTMMGTVNDGALRNIIASRSSHQGEVS